MYYICDLTSGITTQTVS